MLKRLLDSGVMLSVAPYCSVIIFDQSTDDNAIAYYEDAANRLGGTYVHNENRGASAAKREQIIHAANNGYDVMSQVSEDLVVAPLGDCPWLPAGHPSFITDSEEILKQRSHIQFVNHNATMCGDWDVTTTWQHRDLRNANLSFHKLTGSRLAHLEGEVMITGWPYTGRVKFLQRCVEMMLGLAPSSVYEKFQEGGEHVLARYTMCAGASLVARSFYHDRGEDRKPNGSRP